MNAVRDENGEMVASDRIDPVTVTATFKHVAERLGRVELRFRVHVPDRVVGNKLQLRLRPVLFLGDSLRTLDSILVTGAGYRDRQLRGYERYARFLESVLRDSSAVLHRAELELFLQRNLPAVYALKTDSLELSDEQFASLYGVTEQEAVEHYTDRFRQARHLRRSARRGEMYRRYVQAPFVREGLRLDTVVRSDAGGMDLLYVHAMRVPPKLKKAKLVVSGAVFEQGQERFRLPPSDTLTFYISSLSTLAEDRERYLMQVVERRVEANSVCWIAFAAGSAELDPQLGDNPGEMARIAANLRELTDEGSLEMDSIVVTASCSPEGNYAFNRRLSQRRSESVSRHYAALLRDECPDVRFLPRSEPENWALFESLLRADTLLAPGERAALLALFSEPDPDRRERLFAVRPSYRYVRERIYPYLRTVRFQFCLHRRGMQKDTIHTTVPDTVYRAGVQALRARDYRKAVRLLRPYEDLNTALAYCALDYNASALSVLEKLPRDARTCYLGAILQARRGNEAEALRLFREACAQEPSFVHRGNLDPEVSTLLNKYRL